MKLVFDTNIFLAAMNNKGGFSRALFFSVIRGEGHQLFISPDILLELNEKCHQLILEKFIDKKEFKNLIKLIYRKFWPVTVKERLAVVKQDPDDDRILECGVAANADLIITMDHHLLKLRRFRNIAIVHPSDLYFMLPK